jgi:CRP-like cAMP-binding protein
LREVFFKAGQEIFNEREVASHFYVLVDGVVEIYDPDTSVVIGRIKEGQTFGEQAALSGGARTLSARAISDCHCLEHSAKELRELMLVETGETRHALELLSLQLDMFNALRASGASV